MRLKDWLVSLIGGIVLGGILYGSGITPGVLTGFPVSGSNSVDTALSTVLVSHTKWTTLQGSADFIWHGPSGETQTYMNLFAFSQPNLAYVDVINLAGTGNDGIWISDGKTIYDLNKEEKTYVTSSFPAHLLDMSMLPVSLSEVKPDTVYMHPMALLVPAPIKEYIFPSWFAQPKPGTMYQLIGEEMVLNRKSWVVTCQNPRGDQSTAWIDQETGIFLQYHQQLNGKPFLEMKMNQVEINNPIFAELFLPTDGYVRVEVGDDGGSR